MNIYIIGAPTSGKSTLARMLKRKLPELNAISFEAIRNGFIKSQPELDMGNRNSVARREILPPYIVEFAEWNEKMTGDSTLVEGSFGKVVEVSKLIRQEDILVCLGYGGLSLDEVAKKQSKTLVEIVIFLVEPKMSLSNIFMIRRTMTRKIKGSVMKMIFPILLRLVIVQKN